MSQLHQSLESNQKVLEEVIALSEQKSLIIQKYMQKLTTQEGKIEELVSQIQILNWEKRQQEYRDQYVKRYPLLQLINQGFAQEILFNQPRIQLNQKQAQLNQKQAQLTPKNRQNIVSLQKQNNQQQFFSSNQLNQRRKRYCIKILLAADLEQVVLTEKMQLLKENSISPTSQSSLNIADNQQLSKVQIYCQQVLAEVQEMKAKLQSEQKQKQLIIQKLKSENISKSDRIGELQQKIIAIQKHILEREKQILNLEKIRSESTQNYENQLNIKVSELGQLQKIHKIQLNEVKNSLFEIQKQHAMYLQKLQVKDKAIQQNQKTIQEKEKSILEKDKVIEQKDKNLQEKDKAIRLLKQKYTEANSKYLQIGPKYLQQQRQFAKNSKSITQTVDTQCQTDPDLIFDTNISQIHFHQFGKGHSKLNQKQESKLSLPPPSLDMINFDFDNSHSSQLHNISNISPSRKQNYSNFSSQSFSRNQKQIEQMLLTKAGIVQEGKHSSLQDIQIPHLGQMSEENRPKQKSSEQTTNTVQAKAVKSQAKIASYSQQNIIIEDPNQDQQHHETRQRSNHIFELTKKNQQQSFTSQKQEQLIPSRSHLSYSFSSANGSAHPYDRDSDLQNSSPLTPTYKRSLGFPNKKSQNASQIDSEKNIFGKSQNGSKDSLNADSQTFIETNLKRNQTMAQKATELLEMKRTQNVMKSLIKKSFPIQKNPFKLSSEYMNVAQLVKGEQNKQKVMNLQVPQKPQNGSQSLLNIMILTENNKQAADQLKNSSVLGSQQNNRILKSSQKIQTSEFKEQKQTPAKQSNNANIDKIKETQQSVKKNSSKKLEFIGLADSLDFGSLKKQEKQRQDKNNSSKKKQKIIYLRR